MTTFHPGLDAELLPGTRAWRDEAETTLEDWEASRTALPRRYNAHHSSPSLEQLDVMLT